MVQHPGARVHRGTGVWDPRSASGRKGNELPYLLSCLTGLASPSGPCMRHVQPSTTGFFEPRLHVLAPSTTTRSCSSAQLGTCQIGKPVNLVQNEVAEMLLLSYIDIRIGTTGVIRSFRGKDTERLDGGLPSAPFRVVRTNCADVTVEAQLDAAATVPISVRAPPGNRLWKRSRAIAPVRTAFESSDQWRLCFQLQGRRRP